MTRADTFHQSNTMRLRLKAMRAKISVILDGFYSHDLERELNEEHAFGLSEILTDLRRDLDDAEEALDPIILMDERAELENKTHAVEITEKQ